VRAIANTKYLNFATNLAGLLAMIAGGKVLWVLGLSMAVANVLGNLVGAKLAIRYGGRGVRPLLVVMSAALAIKLIADPSCSPIPQIRCGSCSDGYGGLRPPPCLCARGRGRHCQSA
jgi:hypothetical protein